VTVKGGYERHSNREALAVHAFARLFRRGVRLQVPHAPIGGNGFAYRVRLDAAGPAFRGKRIGRS